MEFVKLLMTRIARLVSCATPPLPHSPTPALPAVPVRVEAKAAEAFVMARKAC